MEMISMSSRRRRRRSKNKRRRRRRRRRLTMTDDDDENDDDQSINAPQRFPPHLHHVATLHCKLKIFKKKSLIFTASSTNC